MAYLKIYTVFHFLLDIKRHQIQESNQKSQIQMQLKWRTALYIHSFKLCKFTSDVATMISTKTVCFGALQFLVFVNQRGGI